MYFCVHDGILNLSRFSGTFDLESNISRDQRHVLLIERKTKTEAQGHMRPDNRSSQKNFDDCYESYIREESATSQTDVQSLDGPAIRNARKTPIFITCYRFARIASNLRFAIFSPPKRNLQERSSLREPEMIRENQAICANLRIDSCKSGQLRSKDFLITFVTLQDH